MLVSQNESKKYQQPTTKTLIIVRGVYEFFDFRTVCCKLTFPTTTSNSWFWFDTPRACKVTLLGII
jgi:hypothetical protein